MKIYPKQDIRSLTAKELNYLAEEAYFSIYLNWKNKDIPQIYFLK